MNPNRYSYPPGYGPSSSARQGQFFSNCPARKTPYWNPPNPHRDNNSSIELGSQGLPTSRKRVNVACARCRKRKIRCSGDPGDNTGCQNCKSAGVAQGQCQFLRVQCEQLAINESQAGPYDRFGQQIYVTNLNLAAQYACLSAPPVANGDRDFGNDIQMQRSIVDSEYGAPSLHPSRSLPNITKRNSQYGSTADESGLALLARNAEVVSGYHSLVTSAAMETLAAAANPPFEHWGSDSPLESLRPTADASPINLRNGACDSDSSKSYTVPNGLSPVYFDTIYTSNPTPQMAPNLGLLPTSNVRSSSLPSAYEFNHVANIATGVGHMTLELQNGKKVQKPQALQGGKCGVTTAVDSPYTLSFADPSEGAPYSPRYSRVLSSPVDAYSVSGSSAGYKPHLDPSVMHLPKSVPETGDPRHHLNSLDKLPSNMVILTNPMRSTSAVSSPTQGMHSTRRVDRHDLVSAPPTLPMSKPIPAAQVPTLRTPMSTSRPTSAGCGSFANGQKYSQESVHYTDSPFVLPMKTSH
ncbi:hypothetical protein TWF481_001568 [Arthrobotrys musiformis]|uniref:Zn(2)-C6 fungal-type domain-containing protein n=1 Tax=Arthrobotrys musiformis TaxID=47236 RepID=A0AAV9VTS2_9PEZI